MEKLYQRIKKLPAQLTRVSAEHSELRSERREAQAARAASELKAARTTSSCNPVRWYTVLSTCLARFGQCSSAF